MPTASGSRTEATAMVDRKPGIGMKMEEVEIGSTKNTPK